MNLGAPFIPRLLRNGWVIARIATVFVPLIRNAGCPILSGLCERVGYRAQLDRSVLENSSLGVISRKHGVDQSDKEWSKTRNDALNERHHFIYRFNHRLALDNSRLIESYIKGELEFLIYLFIAGHSNEDYVTYLCYASTFSGGHKRLPQADERNHISIALVDKKLPLSIAEKYAVMHQGAGENFPMLVDNIQPMERPK